jgi:HSP20 family molecular chaperone IbpA
LSTAVDYEKIEATLENGILALRLPKKEKKKIRKEIKIR